MVSGKPTLFGQTQQRAMTGSLYACLLLAQIAGIPMDLNPGLRPCSSPLSFSKTWTREIERCVVSSRSKRVVARSLHSGFLLALDLLTPFALRCRCRVDPWLVASIGNSAAPSSSIARAISAFRKVTSAHSPFWGLGGMTRFDYLAHCAPVEVLTTALGKECHG